MLTTAMLMAAAPASDDKNKKTSKPMTAGEARAFVLVFILLLVIDLALLVYTLYCLFECKLAWYWNVLILLCLFTPGLGFITSIAVIVYHYTTCRKTSAPAFEFEFF
jgi:hypothetical protein